MNRKSVEKKTDAAVALQARDWKGFGTGFQSQNGVVECHVQSEPAEEEV